MALAHKTGRKADHTALANVEFVSPKPIIVGPWLKPALTMNGVIMRRTLIGMALGLLLPLGVAHADVIADSLKAGLPMQEVFEKALADGISEEQALRRVFELAPDQAYAAITAETSLSPDQAATIVSIALGRQYNLNPPQVTAAALQGAPQKASVIVPTAIVKSPSYYTVAIVQRALGEGVDGSKFIPQAMRTSPRQADNILTQALKTAPQQTRSIMEAVIADQPDKATHFVGVALDAKAPAGDVVAGAFKSAPNQADNIAGVAREKGVDNNVIKLAANTAGIKVTGMDGNGDGAKGSPVNGGISVLPSPQQGSGGGGGGGSDAASPK